MTLVGRTPPGCSAFSSMYIPRLRSFRGRQSIHAYPTANSSILSLGKCVHAALSRALRRFSFEPATRFRSRPRISRRLGAMSPANERSVNPRHVRLWWQLKRVFRTWEYDSAWTELRPVDVGGCCHHGYPCHQQSSGAMTMKRKRRTAAQSNGLAPGETLNRTQLPGREELCWGWISSVPNATNISDDHLLRTCGFSPHSQLRFCHNQYARSPNTGSVLPPGTDPDGDLIVVSDDEGPVCDKKSCQSNPYCSNYLGQKMWEDEGVPPGNPYRGSSLNYLGSSKESYLQLLKLGPDPITRVREPGQPVGLKVLVHLNYTPCDLITGVEFGCDVLRKRFPSGMTDRTIRFLALEWHIDRSGSKTWTSDTEFTTANRPIPTTDLR
jgi:hypothetical protein